MFDYREGLDAAALVAVAALLSQRAAATERSGQRQDCAENVGTTAGRVGSRLASNLKWFMPPPAPALSAAG